ncbi:hypothetical protein J7T55_002922 [Diaporthe amygdali]|uniref:uncharacterized protein n=1 Tax=Phomopsis amygdali TaxID=1214568 RepID=UPI0022FE4A42|nr:uncharacterized protein J7T55_002922 [Diaporthe amygdali]KAJ0122409.1 hypothetical protein J7T55_002922 [Diaporthe amygdali]
MNGTRPNRRHYQYRAGQAPKKLSQAEKKELALGDYSDPTKGYGRNSARVLSFKETGIRYTKNYVENKEACDALRRARFEMKVPVWPRDESGERVIWHSVQVEDHPSGRAKDAAEAKKMNLFYPHQDYAGGLICSAPFSKGEKSFCSESTTDTPDTNEGVWACQAMAVAEIRFNILKHLSYPDIGALQGTCTMLANQIMSTPALWDMTYAKCNYSEFTKDEFAILKQNGEAGEEAQQGNSEFVMVSQTHMGLKKTLMQDQPVNVVQIRGLLSVGRSLQLRGDTIKRVCFNRVNFFDAGVFATFLDQMHNLERADITSCDLIRYHHVPALLDTVHTHNKKYQTKVLLDVAPRYHVGPLWENGPDGNDREGAYGLTYSNPGIKIPTAVCKLFIYDIAPRLKKTGQMHMMQSNALFRRFLEKLPLHSKTVPRMEAVAEHKDYLKRLFAKGKINDQQKAKLEIRCAFAELVTVFGKEGWIQLLEDGLYSTSEQGTAENYGVWADTAECNTCRTNLAMMYYTSGYVCDSCLMKTAVDRENYHYKRRKMQATSHLGCGYPGGPLVPLEKTNMDYSVMRYADGTPRITQMDDFDYFVEFDIHKLRGLFKFVRGMDNEGHSGFNLRDLGFQRKHPYDRCSRPSDTQSHNLGFMTYRRPLSLEEIQKLPKGRVFTYIGQF